MQDDLVNVYNASSLAEARMLADRLEQAGIKTFIDNDDSPLDGLTFGTQTQNVRVLPDKADQARAVVAEFQAESE